MKNMILEHKTGFLSSMPFEILDSKGLLFYDSSFTNHIYEGRVLKFNLPAGIYQYNGNFIKLQNPVPVLNIDLPAKERNINNGKKYKIVFGDNENKCTIFYKTGIILFDYSLANMPLYVKYGIYFHELGHHYYSTESKADLYAAKKMLDYGFNPSQIGRVHLMTLSNGSFDRKKSIINKLTKNLG